MRETRKDNNNWLLLNFPSFQRKKNGWKFKTVESNIKKSDRYRASTNFLSLRNFHWHKITINHPHCRWNAWFIIVFCFIADVFSFVNWIPLLKAIRVSFFLSFRFCGKENSRIFQQTQSIQIEYTYTNQQSHTILNNNNNVNCKL